MVCTQSWQTYRQLITISISYWLEFCSYPFVLIQWYSIYWQSFQRYKSEIMKNEIQLINRVLGYRIFAAIYWRMCKISLIFNTNRKWYVAMHAFIIRKYILNEAIAIILTSAILIGGGICVGTYNCGRCSIDIFRLFNGCLLEEIIDFIAG